MLFIQFDVLERDALEVHRLIRAWRNRVAPIDRIPPEILALIPDFWHRFHRNRDIIALTQVCWAWREVFTSRSSMWTDLDCVGVDKTRVYLERSRSSPINVSLYRDSHLHPHDPLFQITPVTKRFKSLNIITKGKPEILQDIAAHLSHPAPLLKDLSISGDCRHARPRIPSLFNGDLSPLQKLQLECICTELPWRNMVNLMSFKLGRASPVSVRQLLDFFESAPRLREVDLNSPTSRDGGAQSGRLVLLVCLKRMEISGDSPSSALLDHLVIPAGAELTTRVAFPIYGHLPRSLDNLMNLSGFTTVQLHIGERYPRIRLSGPNGQVSVVLTLPETGRSHFVLGSLDQFGTSKTERLEINGGSCPYGNNAYRALLHMKDLRVLTLTRCKYPELFFADVLDPSKSSSGAVVCPKLEEFVLVPLVETGAFDLECAVGMAAARELKGAKLTLFRIVDERAQPKLDLVGVSELRKHVRHVEYVESRLRVGAVDGES